MTFPFCVACGGPSEGRRYCCSMCARDEDGR